MITVVALGGNALLRRSEAPEAAIQEAHVREAATLLGRVIREAEPSDRFVVTHGNGPQVGLLALQSEQDQRLAPYPLDVLDAETEGMIGYLIEQELSNLLPADRPCAALLTQIEVDPADPAFARPSKPIGPIYSKTEAENLAAERGWSIAPDGGGWRRVVPSPLPKRIFEIGVIELLVAKGVIVICAGGGGIPVLVRPDGGLVGIEAVIDKDRASALLAHQLRANALLLLTDVAAVFADWNTRRARAIRRGPPDALASLELAPGSMGPKVEAACDFVRGTGGFAGIGRLEDAPAILERRAGTIVTIEAEGIE